MPYSNRYIMQQMARGRPVPQGSPEPHLHRALSVVSPMEMEEAVHMGAKIDVPDNHRRSSAHILLDHAMSPEGVLRVDPQRFMSCLRFLVRNRANFNLPHPSTGDTAIGRLVLLAPLPIGPSIRQLVGPGVDWSMPAGRGKESVRDLWVSKPSSADTPSTDIPHATPKPR